MQVADKRKIALTAFVIVTINLAVAFFGIAIFAFYYTPGNPIRPNRTDVNIAGYLGMFVGLSQALYLVPLLIYAARSHNWKLVKGAVLGGIVTVLLNLVLLVSFLKDNPR